MNSDRTGEQKLGPIVSAYNLASVETRCTNVTQGKDILWNRPLPKPQGKSDASQKDLLYGDAYGKEYQSLP